MKLFVDDIRNPPDDSWQLVARNYVDAISFMKCFDVTVVSLDHDLGTGQSGYDIAKWIEEQVLLHKIQAPAIICHSQNPVGKKNILDAAKSINRILDVNRFVNEQILEDEK